MKDRMDILSGLCSDTADRLRPLLRKSSGVKDRMAVESAIRLLEWFSREATDLVAKDWEVVSETDLLPENSSGR